MKLRSRCSWWLVMLALWLVLADRAARAEAPHRLSARLAGVEVAVQTGRMTSGGSGTPGTWWGAAGSPLRGIHRFDVVVRGDSIELPRSAFADLAEVDSLRVVGDSREFRILLLGGDASQSFECELRFRRGVLTHRVVRSREFPDQTWERTRYHEHSGRE